MATYVITQPKIWLGEIDLSGDLTSAVVEYGAELQDNTTFGSGGTRSRAGGLKTVAAQVEGYFNGSNSDAKLFNSIGVADVPFTIAPQTGTEDSRAFAFKCIKGEYSPGGSLGEMMRFSAAGEASGADLIRGYVGYNGTPTGSGSSTGAQLGAVGATQFLYASLHVIGFNGAAPTLDVIIESDDNSGFTTAVTRGTFTQATAATSQWLTPVAGAITDDYWRVTYTLGGTITDVTFAVFIGIQ